MNNKFLKEKRKQATYRVDMSLPDRLTAVADSLDIGVSDLVNYLLRNGIESIESGELIIKTKPAGMVIDYGMSAKDD